MTTHTANICLSCRLGEPHPVAVEWSVQGYYFGAWESVTYADSKAEALSLLADYVRNESGTAFRVRREWSVNA